MRTYPSGAQLAQNLQELIHLHRLERLCIFEDGIEPCRDATVWQFGDDSIRVERTVYDLNHLLKYRLTEATLMLFF